MKRKNRGFTLIELLVVIAIIGILASVVLASLNSARQKSRDARRVSDIKQLQLALELYFDANRSYAVALADLVSGGHIAVVPTDPVTSHNTVSRIIQQHRHTIIWEQRLRKAQTRHWVRIGIVHRLE